MPAPDFARKTQQIAKSDAVTSMPPIGHAAPGSADQRLCADFRRFLTDAAHPSSDPVFLVRHKKLWDGCQNRRKFGEKEAEQA